VTEEPTLRDRVRRIAGRLLDAADGTALESAARAFETRLERFAPRFEGVLGAVQRDVLVRPGEAVVVSASLGISRAARARFLCRDEVLAEVAVRDAREVYAQVVAPEQPGLYPLRVELQGEDGRVLGELAGRRLLQVVGDAPVYLVDASLVLSRDDAARRALRALGRTDCTLVYVDLHERNRYAALLDACEVADLPAGATLVHTAEDLRRVGMRFVELFGVAVLRRLRARGIPVTAIVTVRDRDSEQTRVEAVRVLTPDAALRHVRSDAFDVDRAQAQALLAERDATDRLTWLLDRTTGSRRVDGNAFALELDNHRARRALFEALEEARERIDMQVFILRASRFAEELIVHLIRRARAGVQVRFMVDALYSEQEVLGRLNASMRSLSEEPNIEVVAVNPIPSRKDLSFTELKRRDHRKLVILDGERAFVSGRNAANEYYFGFDEVPVHDHTRHERIPWLDAHVELRGPLVAEVQRSFSSTWEEQGGAAAPVPPTPAAAGDAAGRLVVHHGLADTYGLAMYEAMFDAARSHAYIVNDYPFVDPIERAIYRMVARGVRVRILTGSANARRADGTFFPAGVHRTLFEYMVKAKLEPLIRAGVEVFELVPPPSPMIVSRGGVVRPYVHAKMVSIDGAATSVGSANLDATASYWESEANVVVQDAEFASAAESALEGLLAGSLRIDPSSEEWRRERAPRAVVATLWPGALYS